MSIKVILFDLDGTLLPMDQDVFVKYYFGALAKKLSTIGYEPNKLIESIWKGTKSMIQNNGTKSNEQAFWDTFTSIYGIEAKKDMPYFEEFYENDFDYVKNSCGYNPQALEVINKVKTLGFKIILATNPIFPAIATHKRISWAGLNKNDFEYITTYENSRYCKPNPFYYLDIMMQNGIKPDECLMVGNDVSEDMVIEKLGSFVFLLTDNLINKDNKDINEYPHGNFDDLLNFIDKIKD